MALNPVPLVLGVASFSGVNYTNSGHLEEDIYLKAITQPGSISTCIGPISVLHRYNTGSGYSLFQAGGTGAAGASNAAKLDSTYLMQVDSQNRSIVVGASKNTSGAWEMAVWRYNPDGTPDSTFGSGATAGLGYTLFQNNGLNASGGASKYEFGFGIQIDSQGRYVVNGRSRNAAGGYEFVIWRFSSNGSLDTSFGNGATAGLGYVIFQAGGAAAAGSSGGTKYDSGYSLRIDSAGRYVIAGTSTNAVGGSEAVIWRYNSDGSLDTSFGNGATAGLGYVIFHAGGLGAGGRANGSKNDWVEDFEINAQGKYVFIGGTQNVAGGWEPVIWSYNPDGSIDTSFGSGATAGLGYAVINSGVSSSAGAANATKDEEIYDLEIDSQGRYILVGYSQNAAGGYGHAVWRYNPDGSIDTSFGSGATAGLGCALFQLGGPGAAGAPNASQGDYPLTVQIDSQGRYVMAGNSTNAAGGSELVIWRYNSDGSLDTSFGSGTTTGLGYVLFQPGGLGAAGALNASKSDYAWSMRIDSHGRYVMAGASKNSVGANEITIWRYLPSGEIDQ